MLSPSLLMDLRFDCLTASYLTFFALVLQIARGRKKACRVPFMTLLFAPSLHAIMRIEITRPFQCGNLQKVLFVEFAERGSTTQSDSAGS